MAATEPMPMAHSRKAPRFSSDPSGFDEFFDDVTELASRANLSAADTIKWARRYTGIEGDAWQYVPCLTSPANPNPTFAQFQSDVRDCYPHLSGNRRYTSHDLETLLQRTSNFRDMSRDDFGEYYRRFLSYTAYLIHQNRLSERERNSSYLRGFPQPVRARILQRLSVKKPDILPDDGYDFADIHEAASFIFSSGSSSVGDNVPTVVKREPVEQTSVGDLVQAMSDLTKVFTATMSRQAQPPPPRFPRVANPQPTPGGVVQNPPRWGQPSNPDQYQQNCMFCSAQDHFVRNCPVAAHTGDEY